MRNLRQASAIVMICSLALCVSWAQSSKLPKVAKGNVTRSHGASASVRTLSADDRLSVMAATLDSKIPRLREHDCSHLVHQIYERAGFPYSYASSNDLYDGIENFQRVSQPQPGDLVVWHGHVGIVIRPSRHVFFSFLHAAPGIDDYTSRYWRGRGQPRFYRYIKNASCAGCTIARGTRP